MTKRHRLMFLATLSAPAVATAQQTPGQPGRSLAQVLSTQEARSAPTCKDNNPNEVVVCGRSPQRYRIDPNVLAATRAAEAPPSKAPLDATNAGGCIGSNCGGGTIPLVAMALTALKAAELAAQGDDWKEAFRTHADQYQAYQRSKEERGKISIGVTAGNRRPQPGTGY